MPEVVVYLLEGRSLEQKRTGERHHAGRGEECRHDRRSGDRVTGRDSENLQGQRRRPLQRNGRPLKHDPEKWAPVFGKDHAQTGGEPHSRHEPIATHGVNNPVSALHNSLAAVQ
jgi:hypothetical protein